MLERETEIVEREGQTESDKQRHSKRETDWDVVREMEKERKVTKEINKS